MNAYRTNRAVRQTTCGIISILCSCAAFLTAFIALLIAFESRP